jgi:hypothetical protein
MIIESHDDDSITVTAGSITAHIRGDGWADASKAARALGGIIEASYDVNALVRKLDGLRGQLLLVDDALRSTAHEASHLFDWLNVPPGAGKR